MKFLNDSYFSNYNACMKCFKGSKLEVQLYVAKEAYADSEVQFDTMILVPPGASFLYIALIHSLHFFLTLSVMLKQSSTHSFLHFHPWAFFTLQRVWAFWKCYSLAYYLTLHIAFEIKSTCIPTTAYRVPANICSITLWYML